MSLESNINEDLKNAMKAKDQAALRGIRAIKSAILLYNTSGAAEELNTEKEIALLKTDEDRKEKFYHRQV